MLDAFVVDGRIEQLPAAHAKRRVVLDWLAQHFEPGRRYREPDVNALLREHLDDVAAGAATSSTRAFSPAPRASTGAPAARCVSTMT